jgi:hypothetical protein
MMSAAVSSLAAVVAAADTGDLLGGMDLGNLAGGITTTAVLLMVLTHKGLVPSWVADQAEERAQAAEERADKRVAEAEQRTEQMRSERDAALDATASLQDALQDRIVPLITRATDVLGETLDEERRRRWAAESDRRSMEGR